MGDPTGGLFSLASAGGGGGSSSDGVSAGDGGTDPSAGMGGADPSFGMGPFDPATGMGAGDIGAGSSFGSFSGQIPGDPTSSLSARQSINPQGLNQPPITDQPQPSPQAASQTLPQSANPAWLQQAVDVNHALFHGPTSLSGTPGEQQVASGAPPGNPLPASTHIHSNMDPQDQFPYRGSGVSQFTWGESTDADVNDPWARLPNTDVSGRLPATFKDRFPGEPAPSDTFRDRFQPFADSPQPPAAPAATRGITLTATPPDATSTATPPDATPPAATPPAATPPAATPPAATPPAAAPPAAAPPAATPPAATPPAAATPGTTPGMNTGMGGQGSPLEQLIGQFVHMMLGGQGGVGGMLEQMIDRALGINPQRLFTGGGFNPPPPQPGSGYLPAGASGGRAVSPGMSPRPNAGQGGQPATSREGGTGTPPLPRPGPPGSPGNPPSAVAPKLPGYPYTANSSDKPPPWYHENHPQAPDGTPSPSARQAGAGTANTTGIPNQVLGLARQWAAKGGPASVFQFMKQQGYPRSGAWCGEFAAAVMHSQGLPVPKDNPAVASNWRTWGSPTTTPKPGDIAVRKGVPTGHTGSHVTMVTSIDPARGTVTLTGGNQGHAVTSMQRSMREWDFRTMRSSSDQIRAIRYQPQMGL